MQTCGALLCYYSSDTLSHIQTALRALTYLFHRCPPMCDGLTNLERRARACLHSSHSRSRTMMHLTLRVFITILGGNGQRKRMGLDWHTLWVVCFPYINHGRNATHTCTHTHIYTHSFGFLDLNLNISGGPKRGPSDGQSTSTNRTGTPRTMRTGAWVLAGITRRPRTTTTTTGAVDATVMAEESTTSTMRRAQRRRQPRQLLLRPPPPPSRPAPEPITIIITQRHTITVTTVTTTIITIITTVPLPPLQPLPPREHVTVVRWVRSGAGSNCSSQLAAAVPVSNATITSHHYPEQSKTREERVWGCCPYHEPRSTPHSATIVDKLALAAVLRWICINEITSLPTVRRGERVGGCVEPVAILLRGFSTQTLLVVDDKQEETIIHAILTDLFCFFFLFDGPFSCRSSHTHKSKHSKADSSNTRP